MSRLVVDTDVVSFLFKNHPIAKLYDSELLGHTLMLSFMTVAGSFSGSGARRGAPGLIITWILSGLSLPSGALQPSGLKSLLPLKREDIESSVRTPGSLPPHCSTTFRS